MRVVALELEQLLRGPRQACAGPRPTKKAWRLTSLWALVRPWQKLSSLTAQPELVTVEHLAATSVGALPALLRRLRASPSGEVVLKALGASLPQSRLEVQAVYLGLQATSIAVTTLGPLRASFTPFPLEVGLKVGVLSLCVASRGGWSRWVLRFCSFRPKCSLAHCLGPSVSLLLISQQEAEPPSPRALRPGSRFSSSRVGASLAPRLPCYEPSPRASW